MDGYIFCVIIFDIGDLNRGSRNMLKNQNVRIAYFFTRYRYCSEHHKRLTNRILKHEECKGFVCSCSAFSSDTHINDENIKKIQVQKQIIMIYLRYTNQMVISRSQIVPIQ